MEAVTPPRPAGVVDVAVTTPLGSSVLSGAYTYTVPDVLPIAVLEQVANKLQDIVDGDPLSPLADKLEDVIAKLDDAIFERSKTPPDIQAAMGAIEGAVGDLEVAVSDGLLDSVQGTQCMTQLASAARQLAVAAIDAAIAGGGDPDGIANAQLALGDGDAAGLFKDAVANYKAALAAAEGA